MTTRSLPRHSRFRSLLRFALSAAIPVATLTAAEDASAQGWLKDRRYTEGEGIRVGDLELHPGIGGEIGYDSNWFLRTHNDGFANSNPEGAGVIRITPSFDVSTLTAPRLIDDPNPAPPQSIVFRGGVSATYREFIGSKDLRDQRNISGAAQARVDLNANRPISFGIFAGYTRLIQPNVVADPNLSFNRSDVTGGGELIILPGGGTLDLRAKYQLYAALFEETQGVPYTNLTHDISVRNRWKFRPRTALFHETGLQFINYPYADRAINYLNDSTPVRTRFGLTGLITEKIGALAAVGYGATFFRNPQAASSQQFDSITLNGELSYYLASNPGAGEPGQVSLLLSSISAGYVRDFQNSLLANYRTSDKGYVRFSYLFSGRAVMDLTGAFEALSYPEPFVNTNTGVQRAVGPDLQPINAFTNYRASVSLFGEYRFTNRFGLNTTIDYTETISDTILPAGGNPAPGTAVSNALFMDQNWRRFQAFLGARYFF